MKLSKKYKDSSGLDYYIILDNGKEIGEISEYDTMTLKTMWYLSYSKYTNIDDVKTLSKCYRTPEGVLKAYLTHLKRISREIDRTLKGGL